MVEQNRSGSYTEIVYGPLGDKLALMNGQTLTKAFVPLPGGATAVYNSSALSYYRHADWLGSSRFASTPSRAMYSDEAYAPYGESYAEAGTTDRSFTGQNQDTAPAIYPLYDFLFREYHPTQGRWISPDPLGGDISNPQSLNRYAYVLNNPCSLVDPLGLDPCSYNISLLPGRNSPLNGSDFATGIQNEIKRIFDLAGLGVNFAGNSPDYTLVVANAVPSSIHLDPNAIGFTNTDLATGNATARGTVYASRLQEFDPATARSTAFLAIGLGRAGAHEAGHYLLQLLGHTSSGLMQAGFSGSAWHLPDTTGQFAFTPAQMAALQRDCAKRHSSPGASGGNPGAGDAWLRFYQLALLDILAGTSGSGWYGPGTGEVGCAPNCPPPPPGWVPPLPHR
jgi:RHS repeat-associated protein